MVLTRAHWPKRQNLGPEGELFVEKSQIKNAQSSDFFLQWKAKSTNWEREVQAARGDVGARDAVHASTFFSSGVPRIVLVSQSLNFFFFRTTEMFPHVNSRTAQPSVVSFGAHPSSSRQIYLFTSLNIATASFCVHVLPRLIEGGRVAVKFARKGQKW